MTFFGTPVDVLTTDLSETKIESEQQETVRRIIAEAVNHFSFGAGNQILPGLDCIRLDQEQHKVKQGVFIPLVSMAILRLRQTYDEIIHHYKLLINDLDSNICHKVVSIILTDASKIGNCSEFACYLSFRSWLLGLDATEVLLKGKTKKQKEVAHVVVVYNASKEVIGGNVTSGSWPENSFVGDIWANKILTPDDFSSKRFEPLEQCVSMAYDTTFQINFHSPIHSANGELDLLKQFSLCVIVVDIALALRDDEFLLTKILNNVQVRCFDIITAAIDKDILACFVSKDEMQAEITSILGDAETFRDAINQSAINMIGYAVDGMLNIARKSSASLPEIESILFNTVVCLNETAISYIKTAKPEQNESKKQHLLAQALLNLTLCADIFEKYQKLKVSHPKNYIITLNNLACAYKDKGETDQAINQFERLIVFAQAHNFKDEVLDKYKDKLQALKKPLRQSFAALNHS